MGQYDNLQPEEIVYLTSQKIARELKHSEPEQKKPLNFKKISGIKKAAPELQKYIEDIDNNDTPDDDIIIGGSSATFTQVKRFRVPKDLDISTPYLNKEVRNISAILIRKYGANNVVVSPKFRTEMDGKDVDVVQIKIKAKNGELVDAVDIKHEVDLGFLSVYKHPKLMIGRLYVEPVGYLVHRKAAAIEKNYVRKIRDGKVPRARVKKDADDFISMAKSVPDFRRKNLSSHMTEFERNLQFDQIPEKDPAETLSTFDIWGGSGDPFGVGSFSFTGLKNKKRISFL